MEKGIHTRAGKLKDKWEKMMKDHKGPDSMEDFIRGGSKSDEKPQMNKYTITQMPTSCDKLANPLGRLHLQIRQDIFQKLIDEIFKRKRNPRTGTRKATQRAIVEEALEWFFADGKTDNGIGGRK